MATRRSKRTLRSMPPIAKELAKLGGALGASKLIAIADKVAVVEHKAIALDEFMVEVETTEIEPAEDAGADANGAEPVEAPFGLNKDGTPRKIRRKAKKPRNKMAA